MGEVSQDKRYAFRNNTQGWLGALRKDHTGEYRTVSVDPGGIVTLSEEEQRLTAESHQNPKDNPFVVHSITHYDVNTQDAIRTFDAPLLELVANYEGATRPIGHAAQGSADSREEGGTPDAPPITG